MYILGNEDRGLSLNTCVMSLYLLGMKGVAFSLHRPPVYEIFHLISVGLGDDQCLPFASAARVMISNFSTASYFILF